MERIYIANLPEDIRIKDIDDFFKPFGKLMAVDVKNSNPACAFVEFDNPRSAFNAVQARNGYDYEGYRIQVRLVPPNEPSMEGRNRNSNNNGNFNDNWDNRYNSGGNNSNYQGNNMAQYRNSQSFGNSGDMGGGGRNSGGPLNTPIVQYPINSRGNVARRDDGNYSQSPSVAPGYSDDSYCQGLSRSGVQWFDRFLNEGYSRDQARERALERRSEPFVRGNQNPIGQNMSGFDDNMGRGGRGNNSSYGGNNYSDNGGFDMPMSNRNMPGPSGRSFGDNGFNNSNDFGGFNNNQPSMSNFTSGNNSGFSNWVSGSMLQNQPSSNNGGRNFNSGASVKRPAKSDQYTAGQSKRTRPEERNVQAKDSGVLRSAFEKRNQGISRGEYEHALYMIKRLNSKRSRNPLNASDNLEKRKFTRIVEEYERRMKNVESIKPASEIRNKVTSTRSSPTFRKPRALPDMRGGPEELDRKLYRQCAYWCKAEKLQLNTLSAEKKAEYKNKLAYVRAFEKRQSLNAADQKKVYTLAKFIAIKKRLLAKSKNMFVIRNKHSLGGAATKRYRYLRGHGMNERDAKILAILSLEQMYDLFVFPTAIWSKNPPEAEVSIKKSASTSSKAKDDGSEEQKKKVTEVMRITYKKSLRFLQKFEDKNIEELSDREKAFIRISLRRKLQYEKENDIEAVPSKFKVLLEEELPENEQTKNEKEQKEGTENTNEEANEEANDSIVIDEEVQELIGEIDAAIEEEVDETVDEEVDETVDEEVDETVEEAYVDDNDDDDDDVQLVEADDELCEQEEENQDENIVNDEEFVDGGEEFIDNDDVVYANDETA